MGRWFLLRRSRCCLCALNPWTCRNMRIKGDPVQTALFMDPISAWFSCFVEPRKALGANWDRTRMSKWANWEESWSAFLSFPPLVFPSVQRSLFYSTSGNPQIQMNYTHLLRQPHCTLVSLEYVYMCCFFPFRPMCAQFTSVVLSYEFADFFVMPLHIFWDKKQLASGDRGRIIPWLTSMEGWQCINLLSCHKRSIPYLQCFISQGFIFKKTP